MQYNPHIVEQSHIGVPVRKAEVCVCGKKTDNHEQHHENDKMPVVTLTP